MVVTSAERAKDLPNPPVLIRSAAQGAGPDQQMMTSYYRESITGLPEMGLVARQLYAGAGVGPDDIDVAVIYDHFTPFVLVQLEEFGFCGRGEAPAFLADGHCDLVGKLPLIPQVANVHHVLVTAGTGVPTSGVILGRG